MSEFLSRMSHELRTPLNAILGFAQVLEMGQLGPEDRDSVAHILKGGRHLLVLINEVLDIARIEAGRLPISIEPVAVAEVCQEALDLIAPLAGARRIEIRSTCVGTDDQHVLADRQRIKQVLLNLLSNAVKYNHEGGRVTLACELSPLGHLRIVVRDTGYGLIEAECTRLFTPFERLHADEHGVEGRTRPGALEAPGGGNGG